MLRRPFLLAIPSAMLAACAPPADRSFDAPGPTSRLYAVADTAAAADRSKIPQLIDSLDHPDLAVRFLAAATLKDLTGLTLDYHPYSNPIERRPAIDRWRSWYAQSVRQP